MKDLNIKTHATLLIKILGILFVIQLIRIIMDNIFFMFLDRTSLNNIIVHIVFMSIFTIIMLLWSKKKGKSLSIMTNISKSKKTYSIITIIALFLIISTPFITKEYSIDVITSLIYSVIVVPIFEELLFRGYIWNHLKSYYKNEFIIYIVVTILFAIWHLGYLDSIVLNMNIYNMSGNLLFVMLMKVITGLVFGIIIGYIRYKTKNTYSAILAHSIMNLFGK